MARLLALGALAGLTIGLPEAARAATTIPDDQARLLPGTVIAAVVGDVNGDGVRELVRIVADGGQPAVQVVSIGAGGTVTTHGEAILSRVLAPADPASSGDANGMVAQSLNDLARLLVVRVAGHERVLVATESVDALVRSCTCLSLWQLAINPTTDATELRLLPGQHVSATGVTVADLDGDGTDELAVANPPSLRGAPDREVTVLRWQGTTYADSADAWHLPPVGSDIVNIGDTDGLPGDELAMVALVDVTGAASPAALVRLALDPQVGARQDIASLPFPGVAVGIQGPSGPRIAIASPADGTALLSWPAGQDALVESTSRRSGVPLAVLGVGDAARLLLLRDGQFVDVLDGTLLPRQGLTGSPAAAPFLDSDLPPFVGILPGGLPEGSDAVIFRGRLAQAPGSTEAGVTGLVTNFMAVLPGVRPVGVFGHDGNWMGLVDGAVAISRDGGAFGGPASPGTVLSVVPTAEVLTPESGQGSLQPEWIGATAMGVQPARATLGASGAFQIGVTAPPGSRVALDASDPLLATGGRTDESGHLTLNIHAAGPSDGSDFSFSFRLQVATPGGHGYGDVWEVQILRRPPPLSASASTTSLAFDVPIHGQTRAGASVTMDGAPVEVSGDGTFALTVPGGILPRDVTIVATDAVGNQARTTLSVVAISDYRTWPWIPIVIVLTLLAGALLYLRAPHAGSSRTGTLEEIE